MLTIVCGEDSVSSFNFYSLLKKDYIKKNFEIIDIPSSELENISLWMGNSMSLFNQNKVFFTQNINKKLSRKINLKINKIVEDLIKNKKIEIIDWEQEISSRFLKFPKQAGNLRYAVKEFKPTENIFKLQDSLYPGNLINFISLLNQVSDNVDENFIFIMLARHLRNLLLVKLGEKNSKLQKWQEFKLNGQASKWTLDKLVNFYDSFYKIDVSAKTSSNVYSIKDSLELLSSYYL